MIKFFRGLLGGTQPAETPMQVPFQPVYEATAADTTSQTEASEAEFSLTGDVHAILGAQMAKQTVKRHGHRGFEDAPMPVAAITLREGNYISPVSIYEETGRGARFMGRSEESTVRPEHASLTVKLSRPAGDYDRASLTAAMHAIVKAIPALAGKVEEDSKSSGHLLGSAPHAPNYGDVWNELKPLLEAKNVSPQDIALISQFYEAHKARDDSASSEWDQSIDARHNAGQVHISVEAKELKKDTQEHPVVSTDHVITEWFTQHHDALLGKMKEHILSLKNPDGTPVLAAHELDKLAMKVEATGWNIAVDFASKLESEIDPKTGQKMTDDQIKELKKTPLEKIDTKQLAATFRQALLECSPQLPPIFPRIADGAMIKDVLLKRTQNAPEIAAFIAAHGMFKNEDVARAEEEAHTKAGIIRLGEPVLGETHEGKSELTLGFDLPQGLTVTQLMESIALNRSATAIALQQTTGMSSGIAA